MPSKRFFQPDSYFVPPRPYCFMTELLFATNNRHKIEELEPLLPKGIQVITLQQAGIVQDIPEPHDTLEANAREKMKVIFALTGKDCFSEDTGLEVEALGGAPGVRSARYAGEGATHAQNISKLLDALEGCANRRARFRTVIALQYRALPIILKVFARGR